MSRGKKLDLFVGADLGKGWTMADEQGATNHRIALEPAKHALYCRREKRRGKTVTIVGPFSLSASEVKAVLKSVKKHLGSGGTIKAEWMEFQGECAAKVRQLLEAEGFGFKR